MERQAYPSDLTDAQWELIRPMIPPERWGGRTRSVDMRQVLNGILYLLRNGCVWRARRLFGCHGPCATSNHRTYLSRDEPAANNLNLRPPRRGRGFVWLNCRGCQNAAGLVDQLMHQGKLTHAGQVLEEPWAAWARQ